MKAFFTLVLALLCTTLSAQRKRITLYDTLGHETTYEMHFAAVVIGTHKSSYDKAANKKVLVPMPKEEFAKELQKTEKRIQEPQMVGKNMPDFDLADINGNRISKKDLAGKVAVINFWFIGCAPCEMERPALNILRDKYRERDDVVFLSIARDSLDAVTNFVKDQPINYTLYPSTREYIKETFSINQFPINIVADRQGKYFFYGTGSGIGIVNVMQKQIEAALAAK